MKRCYWSKHFQFQIPNAPTDSPSSSTSTKLNWETQWGGDLILKGEAHNGRQLGNSWSGNFSQCQPGMQTEGGERWEFPGIILAEKKKQP